MSVRKIIHCDCDCFYASIEMRDNPELRGIPIAVGGSSERRGVIATCNYEARNYGIHSAMASATAKKKCPQLIILPSRMDKYREASQAMHIIFRDYTDLIEPLSLDEAYLDVSDTAAFESSNHFKGSATLIAKDIRQRVHKEIGITLSAGIAPNKFLAKIASDWNKPNGQFVIVPADVDEFVKQLEVRKLHGVGKVTASRMHSLGIKTCEQLRQVDKNFLTEHFGSFGEGLYRLSRGIDDREVKTDRSRKSVSVENTFAEDLPSLADCLEKLPALHTELQTRLDKIDSKYRIIKKFVKIKFLDFVTTTVEELASDSNFEGYSNLCTEGYNRGNRPVRLLGMGVRVTDKKVDYGKIGKDNLPPGIAEQLPLNFQQTNTSEHH